MRRPQSAKPGYKGYWGQASSENMNDQSINAKSKKQVKLMIPDLTTHDFARILPKKIHQDKERLYSQLLQMKQTVNQINEQNTRLKTKISILEKERQKMNKQLLHAPEGFTNKPNTRVNTYMGKGSDKENLMVRNLKKIVRQVKQQNEYLKQEQTKVKKSIKYTKINELQIEMKLLFDENKRIGSLLEELNGQLMNQDQFEKENEELKKYLEQQLEQNKQISQENQKYQEILESLEQKLKTQNEKHVNKEKKLQRDLAIEKRRVQQSQKHIEQQKRQIKSLRQTEAIKFKKPIPANRNFIKANQSNFTKSIPPQKTEKTQSNQKQNQLKSKNEQLQYQLREIKSKLDKTQYELQKRKIQEFQDKTKRQSQMENSKREFVEKQIPVRSKKQPSPFKVEKKETEQNYYDQSNFEADHQEEKYGEQFQQDISKESPIKDQKLEKYKQQLEGNDEEQQLYMKEEAKDKKKDKKKKKNALKETGFKPNKKILSEIKQLLTYRMKSQRYPFSQLQHDIEVAESQIFSKNDLSSMLINEPFFLTESYSNVFLQYCFQKENISDTEMLQSYVLITKLKKVIDEFQLLDQKEERQMIIRIAEMTCMYPAQLEAAFENIKNGENTISRANLIQMFQKLELEPHYIEVIIAELSLCSDDLQHLNYHGFFERFYVQDNQYQENAIQEQGQESEESFRPKEQTRKGTKQGAQGEDRMVNIMPVEHVQKKIEDYENDDIISDDGRI